jgi:hypothetical protein
MPPRIWTCLQIQIEASQLGLHVTYQLIRIDDSLLNNDGVTAKIINLLKALYGKLYVKHGR